jgi:ABC-type multidrug transport system ATPase subunit
MTAEATTERTGTGHPVIEVADLGHSFGDLEVLADVSFAVNEGSVTCLIGPNGSGKTTLLRAVTGLLDYDEGTVTRHARNNRAVGYLAQQPAFRPQFTVRETLSFYGSLVEADVDVEAIIEQVGLSEVADRRVGALSGGMLRLLGIAQTTVGDPPLLVLDEPSSGLDPTMTRHITGVVGDLATSGDAVLLATHDLVSVERVADQVLVLDRGEIVATGPPDALLEATETETLEDSLAELTREEGGVSVFGGRTVGDQ